MVKDSDKKKRIRTLLADEKLVLIMRRITCYKHKVISIIPTDKNVLKLKCLEMIFFLNYKSCKLSWNDNIIVITLPSFSTFGVMIL